jgi:hypothetical protein
VALLEDGVIAAVGTHTELLATVPAYRSVLSSTDDERRLVDRRSRKNGGPNSDKSSPLVLDRRVETA